MSIELMSRIFNHSQTKHTARMVLLVLADSANDEGECYPSLSKVAKKAGVSLPIARANLKALTVVGVVSVEPRYKDDRQTSNLYRIHVDKIGQDAISKEILQDCKPPSRKRQGYNKGDSHITQVTPHPCNTGDSHPPITRGIDESSLRIINESASSDAKNAGEEKTRQYKKRVESAIKSFYTADSTLKGAIQTHLNITLRERNKTHAEVLQFLREVEASPADIQNFAAWWIAMDWRGKQGQPPTPTLIIELWHAAVNWQNKAKSKVLEVR